MEYNVTANLVLNSTVKLNFSARNEQKAKIIVQDYINNYYPEYKIDSLEIEEKFEENKDVDPLVNKTIHCKTKEIAFNVLFLLEQHGFRWQFENKLPTRFYPYIFGNEGIYLNILPDKKLTFTSLSQNITNFPFMSIKTLYQEF